MPGIAADDLENKPVLTENMESLENLEMCQIRLSG